MKKLIILFLLITSVISAQEKEFRKSLNGIKKVHIKSNTTVNIKTNTSSELVVSKLKRKNSHFDDDFCGDCHHDQNDEHKKKRKDKRKGLTAIYPGGKDNTNGFGFSISQDGTTLIVKDLKSHYKRNGIQIALPKSINIVVDAGQLGNVFVKGFSSEVEVETKVGKITMEEVTGPITAHSSVGPITIDFSKVSQTSPITISTSVSEIDVALPTNTKASLDMKTNGTVYTNFDLQAEPKDGLRNISSKKITGDINNGGVKIKLKSSMGNIYLRKK